MLKVTDLTLKTKSDKKIIVDKANLEIGKNEIHCLLGKNGSGKTSLAYALMGINLSLIESGEIVFLGKNITKKKIHKRAKLGLTLAFQEPARFEGLSVKDFLLAGNKRKARKNIENTLKILDLDETILNRKIDDKLSGGERKRIELASVVLMEPKLMILDEPDASLDIIVYNELYDLLLKIKKQLKCSILLITHREEAGLIADKATLIDQGKTITSGKFRAVMLEYCRRSNAKKKCMAGRKARNK
ncbi:MAG: ATP-binding cassette domain-containing protein [Candidatus Moranbacteria bacterium]|nr:ATP-binding cassette domain-containing protein [Candidatus Moranbacteria bacterium]